MVDFGDISYKPGTKLYRVWWTSNGVTIPCFLCDALGWIELKGTKCKCPACNGRKHRWEAGSFVDELVIKEVRISFTPENLEGEVQYMVDTRDYHTREALEPIQADEWKNLFATREKAEAEAKKRNDSGLDPWGNPNDEYHKDDNFYLWKDDKEDE